MGFDPIIGVLRSLLQKAVRMSAPDVALAAMQALRARRNGSWVSQRLQVISFEEAHHVAFDMGFPLKQAGLIGAENAVARSLCTTTKDKSATGLACMARGLYYGSPYVYAVLTDFPAMRDEVEDFMPYLAEPDSAFGALNAQASACAWAAYRSAIFEWDKAFVAAAAYLYFHPNPARTPCSPTAWADFPWHLVYDKHSDSGRQVLQAVVQDAGIQQRRVEAVTFLCGSGQCCDAHPSLWWEAERARCLRHVGLSLDDAESIYADLEPFWIKNAQRHLPSLMRALEPFAPDPSTCAPETTLG